MKTKAKSSGWSRTWIVVAATLMLLSSMSLARAAGVTLGWDVDANSQVVGYRVYYGTMSGNYSQTVDVGGDTTSTFTGLTSNVTYYFVVTGYTTDGVESTPSNEVSFTVGAVSLPIINFNGPGASLNGPADVTLSANAAASNASIDRVEFYAGATKLGEADGEPFQMVWTGAQPGTYDLTAVAYASNGTSASSGTVPLTIVAFGITALERTSSGDYQLAATGVAGLAYDVMVSEDMSNWRVVQTISSDDGSLAFTDTTTAQVPRRFYKLAVNSGVGLRPSVTSSLSSGSNLKTSARARR